MIDNEINKFLKSPLEKLAFILIKVGVSANAITFSETNESITSDDKSSP